MDNTPTPYESLYLHFPFCESKCHYCDFYSIGREKTKKDDPTVFEKALIHEINLRGNAGEFAPHLKTIFLGGGTPSMTEPASMERIFKTLFQYTKTNESTEWTMEANPSSISLEQFKEYRALGVNRVSMGVQSLNPDHLIQLGRVHNPEAAILALETLFKAGFSNVSTDLLCGVPGQTITDLHSHITALNQFPITHLSIYLLTLAPHHKMFKSLPTDDEQLKHLLFIDEQMCKKDFEHYEISNFAKKGFKAKHNLAYWTGASYLGLGPSAHSYHHTKQIRFKNYSSLHLYARTLTEENKLPLEWTETLTQTQISLEKWMLALRLNDGFPLSWIKNDYQNQKLSFFIKEKLLEPHPSDSSRMRPTPRGFSLNDHLIKALAD